MERRSIGTYKDALMQELIRLCTNVDFPGIKKFTAKYHKWCIMLKYPAGRWLRIARHRDIVKYTQHVHKKLETMYLGYPENMCLLGAIQNDIRDYPLLIGQSGRIFCYDWDADELYVVHRNIHDFFLMGMSVHFIEPDVEISSKYYYSGYRFETVSVLISRNIIKPPNTLNKKFWTRCEHMGTQRRYTRWRYMLALDELDDLARCRTLDEVDKYVEANFGLVLNIGYPVFNSLTLGFRIDLPIGASRWDKFFYEQRLHEEMSVVGYLNESSQTKPLFQPVLCIGLSGKIYLYDWIDRFFFVIADCLLTFARIGFSKYIGDFGYQHMEPVYRTFGRLSTAGVSFTKSALASQMKIVPAIRDKPTEITEPPPVQFDVCTLITEYRNRNLDMLNKGEIYSLPWPPGYIITLGEFQSCGTERLLEDYQDNRQIGYDDVLVGLGYAHPYYRHAEPNIDPYIAYCTSEKLFAIDNINGRLCLLADNLLQFGTIGMRNYAPFYNIEIFKEDEPSWYGQSSRNQVEMLRIQRNLQALKFYALENSGETIRIDCTENYGFSLSTACDFYCVYGRGVLTKIQNAGYVILGTISKSRVDPNCRNIIAIGTNTQVYMFKDNMMHKVATSMRLFIRRGFKEAELRSQFDLSWDDDRYFYMSDIDTINLDRVLNGGRPVIPARMGHKYPRRLKAVHAIYAVKPTDADHPWIDWLIKNYLKPYYRTSSTQAIQYTIFLSKKKFNNALQATAFERFGIKGLKLKFDSVIWSMLIDLEYSIYKYPTSYVRVGKFLNFLDTMEFYDDFPKDWRCVSRMTAIAFHASAAIYRYRSKQSLGYWCRYLVEYVGLLFFKLAYKLDSLRGNDRMLFQDLEAILEADGFSFDVEERSELFFRHDFFQKIQDITIEKFVMICGCYDCRNLFLQHKHCKDTFSLRLKICPELGVIDGLCIPHLGEFSVDLFKYYLENDLALSLIEGQLEMCKLPIMLDVDIQCNKMYILVILANLQFLLFVTKTLYRVMHKEIEMYNTAFEAEVQQFCSCLERTAVHSDKIINIGAVGCLSKQEDVRFVKQLRQSRWCKKDFISWCLKCVKLGHKIPEYKNYTNHTLLADFFPHYLKINTMHDNKDNEVINAENIVPAFFLVDAKEECFLDVLDRSILSVDDNYISNLKDVDGTMAMFFGGLKTFLSGLFSEIHHLSDEKDVRLLEYKLGSNMPINNSWEYFVKK